MNDIFGSAAPAAETAAGYTADSAYVRPRPVALADRSRRFLHQGQDYVLEAADTLGLELKLVEHASVTTTCAEKTALIGWPLERIVRALYFSDREQMVGVVLPASCGRLDAVSLFRQRLQLGRRQAKRLSMDRLPYGMDSGACTPFPPTACLGDRPPLVKLIVHQAPELSGVWVDISLGGSGDSARTRSGHLHYDSILTILEKALPGLAVGVDLSPFLRE